MRGTSHMTVVTIDKAGPAPPLKLSMFQESLWEEKHSNGLSDDLDVHDDLIKYTYRECTSSER